MDYVILELDSPNGNGRTYTTKVANEMIKQFATKGVIFGELGYPTNGEYDTVNMARVSHKVNNLRIEGKQLIGTMEVLDTPHGKVLQYIINSGDLKVGLRPRGMAEIDADGIIRNYTAISIDFISNPA